MTKPSNPHSKELVVILHGIGMSPLRMAYLNYRVKKAGYSTLNLGYPSLRQNLERCADFVADKIAQARRPEHEKIHLVTHSMGGLVALHLMMEHPDLNISRAVLVAPPHGGSEVMDFLQKLSITKKIYGPAGMQLTTDYRRAVNFTLPPDTEIGVIAGTRAYEYPMFLSVMKKYSPHDGLVSVASTQIPGVKEHITLRMSHSFLIERSHAQAVHFIANGHFKPLVP